MRLAARLSTVVLLCCLLLFGLGQKPTRTSPHRPLFDPIDNSTQPILQTLHTSLRTLLPILPWLSPPPSHTLLVTLATPSFKPLLLNWLCYLRYKAQWGALPRKYKGPAERYAGVPKVLVLTADEELARELAASGVVTWWLKGVDFDSNLEDGELEELVANDGFVNMRLLDLLLPTESKVGFEGGDLRKIRDEQLEWGTLHYQSLMLERSLAMAALVGALVESQKVAVDDRQRAEREWQERVEEHDWEEDGPLVKEEWVGVKGVLLADSDAVWLSNPGAFLSHPYRISGTHPSFIYSVDMPPSLKTAWDSRTMPCACFVYTRVSDVDAHTASALDPAKADLYSPATSAAEAWRYTALCHVAEVRRAVLKFKTQARALGEGQSDELKDIHWGTAPSFQATAFGPALYLAEQAVRQWGELSHGEWTEVLRSGEVEDLLNLLREVGLSSSEDDPDDFETCLTLAQRNFDLSSNPQKEPYETSLTDPEGVKWTPLRTESLPFDLFPPGMRYFEGGIPRGTKSCVVHANYATGDAKEEMLQREFLWALGGEEGKWTCDTELIARA